jgi:chaperonin GroES
MLRIVGNNVAIAPIFDPDISPGGLYIPEMAKERCDQGIVKYIGPKVKWIEIGDYVLFSGYSGSYLSVEGEGKVIIMPENFVIAKLNHETTEIPGVYFRGKDGQYFPATYEMTIELITQAFHESDWFRAGKTLATTKNKAHYAHSERFTFAGHTDNQLDPTKDPTDDDD